MKNYILLFSLLAISISSLKAQFTSCALANAGPAITSGACLTGQIASVAVPAANCTGGFSTGVGLFYKFVAGSCPEFDITFATTQRMQTILWTTACSVVSGGIECNQAAANVPFSESYSSTTTPALVSGTTYILEIVSQNSTTFSICFNANKAEEPSNECVGASSLGTSAVTFNNGGNCSFSGSFNDATNSDPAPGLLCAGSLENTQWVKFSPTAGTTSFQIVGTAAICSGPVCSFQFGILSGMCGALTGEGCYGNGTYCTPGPDGAGAQVGSTTDGFALAWSGLTTTGFTATITRTGGAAYLGTEQFYLVMDGNANSDCQYTLTGINVQPLPIDLVYFNVKEYTNANYIEFEVASQRENDYFSIERSVDGIVWEVIKVIEGLGNSTTQTKYAYVDDNYEKSENYYRLKQTDFNGDFVYSEIKVVDNSIKSKSISAVYNLLGEKSELEAKGIVIIQYSDGTSEKRFNQ